MNILGTGILFSGGQGVVALETALEKGWSAPGEIEAPGIESGRRYAYQVDLESVQDRTLLKKLRRADKLSKMSVVAAAAALADSGIENITQKKIGIILATAFGAHVTTFDFLDGILDFGEANVSPTAFSNSVHNAAASYISSSLEIMGPTLTITQFRFSFQEALQLAGAWLEQGRCDYLLVGAVEQYGAVLGHVAARKLNSPADGKITPFSFNPTGHVPGEGAVFYLLGREQTASAYCAVEAVYCGLDPDSGRNVDLNVIAADGMLPDESAYLSSLLAGTPVTAYSPIFGSMMTMSAFNQAVAALMLQKQKFYAAPVLTNPHQLNILAKSAAASIKTIRCLDCNCAGQQTATYLTRL